MKFGEMLSRLEKGDADGIIAWHPDRLARNPIDGGKIIYLVDTGKIKSLKFPTFWFEDTPQGKFMLNIAFGQSKYFIDNLSENVKRGLRQKLRRGEYPGWAPLGYLNDYKHHTIIIDKKKHELVKKIFELYVTNGYTLKELADKFHEIGLRGKKNKKISVSTLQDILSNPFYYGVFKYKSEIYQGNHEPIISKKLFDKVQAVMKNRGRKKPEKHKYIFTGFMSCPCGCAITAERQKGHVYYRCTKKKGPCDEKYTREEELIRQLNKILQKVSLPDGWGEKMLKQLEMDKKESIKSKTDEIRSCKDKIDMTEKKLDKLLDSHLEGLVEKEIYLKKKEKLINEKIELEENLMTVRQKGNNWLEPMRDFILKLIEAKKTAHAGDLLEIRAFLKNIGSNFILKGKKFAFLPYFELNLAFLIKAHPYWLGGRDSNPD